MSYKEFTYKDLYTSMGIQTGDMVEVKFHNENLFLILTTDYRLVIVGPLSGLKTGDYIDPEILLGREYRIIGDKND